MNWPHAASPQEHWGTIVPASYLSDLYRHLRHFRTLQIALDAFTPPPE